MFNPAVRQQRDKKGHPLFDDKGKPVFQTATELGYDEKGKKMQCGKEKPPKMTPVTIARGTFTVDGMIGKAELNYNIPDLKFIYLYAPGIGTLVVSNEPFHGGEGTEECVQREDADGDDGRASPAGGVGQYSAGEEAVVGVCAGGSRLRSADAVSGGGLWRVVEGAVCVAGKP